LVRKLKGERRENPIARKKEEGVGPGGFLKGGGLGGKGRGDEPSHEGGGTNNSKNWRVNRRGCTKREVRGDFGAAITNPEKERKKKEKGGGLQQS